MAELAELGPGPHKTGHVATTLGVAAASVASVRKQLVNKGHGLEPAPRGNRVHRAAVRQLHEATDADPRKHHTAADSLMNVLVPPRTPDS